PEPDRTEREPGLLGRGCGSAQRLPRRADVDERSDERGRFGRGRGIQSPVADQLFDRISGQRRLGPTSDRGREIVEAGGQGSLVYPPRNPGQFEREADEAQIEQGVPEFDRPAQRLRIVGGEESAPETSPESE